MSAADLAAVFDWRYNHITLPHHGYGMGPRLTQHSTGRGDLGHDRALGTEKAQPGALGSHGANDGLSYPMQPASAAHHGASVPRHDATARHA